MEIRFISILVASLAGACAPLERADSVEDRLRVSAAVSLSEPLEKLAASFQRDTGTLVEVNLGGSSTLAAQLLAGAAVDLFISADQLQMDRVIAAELIDVTTMVSLVSNQLVFVVPTDHSIDEMVPSMLRAPEFGRIAMGDPAGVPAGVYARRYLKSTGLWDVVVDRMVPARSVRAALAIVEIGAVDAGIVYRTDARVSSGIKVVFEVPVQEGPAIVYPAAVLTEAPNSIAAKRLLGYLQGSLAKAVFEKAGFIVPRIRT